MKKLSYCLIFICSYVASVAQTSFFPGFELPDAPALAKRGAFAVGVKTKTWINPNQLDILATKGDQEVRADRPLTVEIWYPAEGKAGEEKTEYPEFLGQNNDPRRPVKPFSLPGRAIRDAMPKRGEGAFPLVIISHGYTGSRYIMSYLGEHLASQGFAVVAIGHKESTFSDAAGFPSTLLNRSQDILFALQSASQDSWMKGWVNADQTALVGYSMGGYGVLNAAGAGYAPGFVKLFGGLTGGNQALAKRSWADPTFAQTIDPRIKAVVAFAPWGMERGAWDAEGLAKVNVPIMLVAGDQDDISGWEKGVKAIYEGLPKAHMLVYENARHNVAPNAPQPLTMQLDLPFDEYYRYAEPAWDQRRMNNINQHFLTAFLGVHLQNKPYQEYLNLTQKPAGKEWMGFKARTCVGLQWWSK